MVLFALSFQGQVEKYGVYVGIAAFFGLAVLSLLYFSQARELKRLREWAGRAPERARELEQRVVAQASASVARRAPSMPGAPAKTGIAPPRRLAEMPAPAPAAATAAGAQATELAEAVEADEPATNGNVPSPAGPGAAGAANGAAPPAQDAEGEAASGADDGTEQPEAATGDEAEQPQPGDEAAQREPDAAAQAAAVGAEHDAGAAQPADAAEHAAADGSEQAAPAPDAGADHAAEAPDTAAAAAEPDTAAAAAEESAEHERAAAAEPAEAPDTGAEPAHEPDHAAAAAAESAEHERVAATRPGEVPAAVPRATPAQRVGVTPRPAPQPLRQSRPSATPTGRGKRPAGPPPRRPGAKPPREGRSGGTIALFVGLAVLILGGGAFVVSQLGGDDSPTAPNRAAPPPTQADTDGAGGGSAEPAKPPAETNVAVLNGTTFTGLAGQLADRVSEEGGYERGATETNTRDQTIQASTVFYAEGFRSTARKVAELLSISAVEPIDEDTQALAPDADVVVLAGADQAP